MSCVEHLVQGKVYVYLLRQRHRADLYIQLFTPSQHTIMRLGQEQLDRARFVSRSPWSTNIQNPLLVGHNQPSPAYNTLTDQPWRCKQWRNSSLGGDIIAQAPVDQLEVPECASCPNSPSPSLSAAVSCCKKALFHDPACMSILMIE